MSLKTYIQIFQNSDVPQDLNSFVFLLYIKPDNPVRYELFFILLT